MNKITEALAIANSVHGGQVDKVGKPYMHHILRVWGKAKDRKYDEKVQLVAILHDTIEDDETNVITPFFIATLFGWEVANAVNDLTRNKEEDYLLKYIPRVKDNPLALEVKLLDLEDHLDRLAGDESDVIGPRQKAKMRERYTKAYNYLVVPTGTEAK